jgi:hypothetical protein
VDGFLSYLTNVASHSEQLWLANWSLI